MKIGIDVDGVLRDFCQGFESVLKEHYPQYLPESYSGINNWKLSDNFMATKPELQRVYWDEFTKEIMGESPAFEENVEQMKDLIVCGEKIGIQFVCITSQKPHSRYHTLSWLGNHDLNFDTVYFRKGYEKPNVQVDYLVDDSPNNYNYWIEKRGMEQGFILMDRPYNQHIKTDYRVYDIDGIMDYIEID